MTFSIRTGVKEDIPALCEIEHDAAQAYRAVGYDFCADGAVRDEEEHLRGINEGALFVSESEGEPSGFILLWPVDGHAHITEISVATRFQQHGIGRALIDKGEEWARNAGYSAITLTTFTEVPWNAPFYRSIGYSDYTPGADEPELASVQSTEAEYGFHAKPRIAMVKRLKS
ncbi:GNAT family N-acetyltransferase [Hyphococcus flavus]|uniref:GNAT family N-acetyltransferase n=1 Tax=Hyphococcus flavus TaxID=1866326 RepID=A0AAE9ZE71_9PROT|nr:GNAT family N-acetyltransferase [Hyphococcus flavus]WDI31068.1 GNAT family N-acetyltransferase [Hyphococcus flavus]